MAWDNAVVTNNGIALLQKVITGSVLTLDKAAGGSGTVSASALMAQTVLVNQKQLFDIVNSSNVANGKKINILITNEGLLAGYSMNQVGIWAHVDSGASVLFAILQDSAGIQIPTVTDLPDFALNFYAVIDFSNESDFELTVDTSAMVSISMLNEGLAGKQDNIVVLDTSDSLSDTDQFGFYDADAAASRKTSWTNIKARLRAAFDADYASSLTLSAHTGNKDNPHSVTATQAGADPSGTAALVVNTHNGDVSAHATQFNSKLNTNGNASNTAAAFTQAGSRSNVASGDTLATAFGKISKWFADLKTAAFRTAGNAAGNVPIIGSDLGVNDNVPVVTDANGNIKAHPSGILGNAAFRATGSANGLAELGEDGKVPSSQLPSYVDDVLEYELKAQFPIPGESGKIYVDLTTHLCWRWGGSAYAEISPSLALGETSSTAYRGDRGKTAYDHVSDSDKHITASERTKLAGIETGATNYTHPTNHPPSIILQDANNRFMTDAERNKLVGIAEGANAYAHPANHAPAIISQDANNRFVTDAEKTIWNDKVNKSMVVVATLSAASWSSETAPYSYTYTNANISATNPVELLPGDSITAEQLEALQGANIVGGTQTVGSITLLAYGDKPTINIPVQFVIRRDL